jgi:uncharacterized protein (TIGR02246 family)
MCRPLIISTIFSLSLLMQSCQQEENYDNDVETITAISAARAQAFNDGNAAAIAVYFTDDAYLMAPGSETLRGRDAIKDYYQKIFDEYHTELESGYEEVKVDGELAYGRGFAKVRLHPKSGGDPITSTSKYLNILERQTDGKWMTTHDIWNGNE